MAPINGLGLGEAGEWELIWWESGFLTQSAGE